MKKFLFILTLFGGVFLSIPAFAVERIDSFDATIRIREDSAIEVSEKIEYDFGAAQKHGIFRDIPIKYKARGGHYNLRISDISVADEKGVAYKFTTSYPSDNIQIKIGDPNVEITGKHTYVINYTIKRAINYFSDHDELYWNITGDKWPVAIGSASAKIILPQKIESQNIQTDCFAGQTGSTQKCNSILKGLGQTDSVSFSENQLSVGEGLTIVVGFSKGIIKQPTALELALDTAKDNKGILFTILVLVVYFSIWYRRRKYLIDCGPVIAQYDPPENLSPAEIGILWYERKWSSLSNIVAEIINLAIKGHVKIINTEKNNYILELVRDDLSSLTDCQKKIIEKMFKSGDGRKVDISSIAAELEGINHYLNDCFLKNLIKGGYFSTFYRRINQVGVITSLILLFPSFIIGALFLGGFIIGAISFFTAMIIIFIFSAFILSTKSRKGVKAIWYISGLKMYIDIAEKRRIEFHNAPEKKPEIFEKLLPYAIALGVEKQWAKQFEGMYMDQPNWYQGVPGAAFNASMFATSIGDFSKTASATMASSSSGGSGFSGGGAGGGGGGGGGGSW